jgi:hypothetical protein
VWRRDPHSLSASGSRAVMQVGVMAVSRARTDADVFLHVHGRRCVLPGCLVEDAINGPIVRIVRI